MGAIIFQFHSVADITSTFRERRHSSSDSFHFLRSHFSVLDHHFPHRVGTVRAGVVPVPNFGTDVSTAGGN